MMTLKLKEDVCQKDRTKPPTLAILIPRRFWRRHKLIFFYVQILQVESIPLNDVVPFWSKRWKRKETFRLGSKIRKLTHPSLETTLWISPTLTCCEGWLPTGSRNIFFISCEPIAAFLFNGKRCRPNSPRILHLAGRPSKN